jgi:CRISP-associated protein Cas1
MIKRTVEISQQPCHLAIKNDQLLLLDKEDCQTARASIPCEDLGLVLVEHAGTTYSHPALLRLLHHGAAVVLCGPDHLPAGMLLPLGEHTEVVSRLRLQIAAGKPLRKQLWSQIVRAKIHAQADNLASGSAVRSRLLEMARELRSGDPQNVEAQAARSYWGVWLLSDGNGNGGAGVPPAECSALIHPTNIADFRRDPVGLPPNNLLNYGYAVVRAAVARALVSAGLHPALGLHHRNRSDAFCLADDLVEPLRPIVDARVRELFYDGQTELLPPAKAALLELLTAPVRIDDSVGPLMVALHRYAASLVRCLEGAEKNLAIPVLELEKC